MNLCAHVDLESIYRNHFNENLNLLGQDNPLRKTHACLFVSDDSTLIMAITPANLPLIYIRFEGHLQ